MAHRQWLARALAFCLCACPIDRAARAASRLAASSPSPNPSTDAAAAVRNWLTVSSGFFPPQLPADLSQQEVADRADDLMAFQPQVAATLPVVEPQLRFAVLKAPLDVPAIMPSKNEVGWPGSR